MNIAEILKYCPKGTKLYSTIFGEVILNKINIHEKYPIVVYRLNHIKTSFTREGYYMEDFPGSECVLFPSKEQRDWNKFRIPFKAGDIVMTVDGKTPFIFKEYIENRFAHYYCGIDVNGTFKIEAPVDVYWTSDFIIPASEEAKKELFNKMRGAGYEWNADTLELEKILKFNEGDIIINKEGIIFLISKIFDNGNTLEIAAVLNKEELTTNPNVWQSPYGKSIASEEDRNRLFSALAKKGYIYDKEQFIKQEFKSFDKVLVKDMPNHNWSLDLFSHYDEKNKDYPYVCLTSRYRYCIPYEGNEYLVGKTAN